MSLPHQHDDDSPTEVPAPRRSRAALPEATAVDPARRQTPAGLDSAPTAEQARRTAALQLDDALDLGLRAVYQPIVDLQRGDVVAYESLVRAAPGHALERPDQLFDAARLVGRVAQVDLAARNAGLTGALHAGLADPLSLFVNVEPVTISGGLADDAAGLMEQARQRMPVVFEFTERALTARPAELLAAAAAVRAAGWKVALDDVGADSASLALMPFLRPEIVKLDLRLVQQRPDAAVAEIVTAVNAYAQRTGAVVLAEGIEHEEHLQIARSLGATLGQGWLFGRPGPLGACPLPSGGRIEVRAPAPTPGLSSVWELARGWHPPRRSTKPLLVALSKHLEAQAAATGETAVIIGAFQHARHFTAATARRYQQLARRTTLTVALGEAMPGEPASGVRGGALHDGDPLRQEWDVVVLSPHFAAALIAIDLGDTGPESERRFDFVVSYDRDLVADAAAVLVSRVPPETALTRPLADRPPRPLSAALASASPSGTAPGSGPAAAGGGASPEPGSGRTSARPTGGGTAGPARLTEQALAASTNGITIADATRPGFPLIYANDAFARLAGEDVEAVLGRSCRFMQGPETDPRARAAMREALLHGEAMTATVLNYRGPERTPWWNEVTLSPVHADDGTLLQYIGVQQDVTARVQAEQQLRDERDRAAALLQQLEHLAGHDPLTAAANRRVLDRELETVLARDHADGRRTALLYLDLDGFKAVNDQHGHAAGDALLRQAAERIREHLRPEDLLARPGGDEFVVLLPALAPDRAHATAHTVARRLSAQLGRPYQHGPLSLSAPASIGVALTPVPGPGTCAATTADPCSTEVPSAASLLREADQAMYLSKRDRRTRRSLGDGT